MGYILTISIATVIIFVICIALFIYLNRWINKDQKKQRYYTRLTMCVVVISFGSILLMLIMVVMNASIMGDTKEALQVQIKGIPPVNPLIIIKLDDEDYNHFYFSYELVGLYYHEDSKKFWPKEEEISMYIRNSGQQDGGLIKFYLTDENKQFNERIESSVGSIGSFDFKHLKFWIRHENCSSGEGKEEYYKERERCDYHKLSTGKMKWYLKVDCPACLDEVNPKCYSFNICVFNESQKEEWCKLQWNKKDGELTPVECPEDWK